MEAIALSEAQEQLNLYSYLYLFSIS